MTASRMVKFLAWLRQPSLRRSIDGINKLTRRWLSILADAFRETQKPDTAITAAAIAYFALFSLFPITLLSISIASFSLGPAIDRHIIIQRLEFVAPAMGQLLGQNIDEIIEARGPVTAIALVGLIWSGSTVFYTFTHTLNQIWRDKRRRSFWRRRGVAILFVLLFVGPALFLASFAGSLFTQISSFFPDTLISIGSGISVALAILLDVALFMVLYMLLPHGAATWREILPGALGAGLLWELAKKAFLAFVSAYLSVSNMVYGSVAAIIAFLVWAYLSGLIFLFGAYLSVAYFQLRQGQKEKVAEIHP